MKSRRVITPVIDRWYRCTITPSPGCCISRAHAMALRHEVMVAFSRFLFPSPPNAAFEYSCLSSVATQKRPRDVSFVSGSDRGGGVSTPPDPDLLWPFYIALFAFVIFVLFRVFRLASVSKWAVGMSCLFHTDGLFSNGREKRWESETAREHSGEKGKVSDERFIYGTQRGDDNLKVSWCFACRISASD